LVFAAVGNKCVGVCYMPRIISEYEGHESRSKNVFTKGNSRKLVSDVFKFITEVAQWMYPFHDTVV